MSLRGNSRFAPLDRGCNLKLLSAFRKHFRGIAVHACLIALYTLRCQNPADPAALARAVSGGPQALLLDFGGVSLLDPGRRHATDPPQHLDSYSAVAVRTPGWPAAQFRDGQLCIQTQNDFYFDLEAGLRLRFCRPAQAAAARRLQRVLAAIARIERPTAFPGYEDAELRLAVTGLTELRRRLGGIDLSFDGEPHRPVLAKNGLRGAAHYESRPGRAEYLPRRFPEARFHMLLAGPRLVLLYPLPDHDGRFLTLELHSPGLSAAVRAGFRRLPAVFADLQKQAQPLEARATEVYFAAQGAAGDEWLELSSGTRAARLRYRATNAGTTVAGEVFAFAYTSLLFRREDGLKFDDEIETGPANDSETLRYGELSRHGAGAYRSLARARAASADFAASRRCWTGAICGSPGLHPEIVARLRPAPAAGRLCRAEDLRLTEWNPFGLLAGDAPDARRDPGGKFVEFQVLRPCVAGEFLLRAGALLLDPGFPALAAGEVILFAAAEEHFAAVAPGTARLYVDTRLRSLRETDEIALLDLGAATDATEGAETNAPGLPSETRLYTPPHGVTFVPGQGSRGDGPGALLRRIHSLTPPTGGIYPRYHRADTAGLRPDLARSHAMSPGRVPGPPPEPAEPPDSGSEPGAANRLRIDEILPAGAYAADGTSLPGQEFIEFRWPLGRTADDASLLLEIESDGATDRYLLPAPAAGTLDDGSHDPGGGRLVWIREGPLCWTAGPGWLDDDRLRLPNGPAEYRLRDHDGRLLDRLRIEAHEYDELVRDDRRRSLQFVAAADQARPAAGSPARAHDCSADTLATPGRTASFAPFLAFAGEAGGVHALRFFSGAASATPVHWRAGYTFDAPLIAGTQELEHGVTLSLPWPAGANGRLLIAAEAVSAGEPAGTAYPESLYLAESFPAGQELYIATVAPSPPAGGHEWLRLCSTAGFDLTDDAALVLRDASSEDRIVAYDARFPGSPGAVLPLPLDPARRRLDPGQCALVIDPDFDAGTAVYLPPLSGEDRALWTIESSATLGNGLGSGEGLLILRATDGELRPLASYGRPDTPRPFGLATSGGERVERRAAPFGVRYDRIEAWEVAR